MKNLCTKLSNYYFIYEPEHFLNDAIEDSVAQRNKAASVASRADSVKHYVSRTSLHYPSRLWLVQ